MVREIAGSSPLEFSVTLNNARIPPQFKVQEKQKIIGTMYPILPVVSSLHSIKNFNLI